MMLRDSPLIQVIKTAAAAIYTKNRTVLSAGTFFVLPPPPQLFLHNKTWVRARELNKYKKWLNACRTAAWLRAHPHPRD